MDYFRRPQSGRRKYVSNRPLFSSALLRPTKIEDVNRPSGLRAHLLALSRSSISSSAAARPPSPSSPRRARPPARARRARPPARPSSPRRACPSLPRARRALAPHTPRRARPSSPRRARPPSPRARRASRAACGPHALDALRPPAKKLALRRTQPTRLRRAASNTPAREEGRLWPSSRRREPAVHPRRARHPSTPPSFPAVSLHVSLLHLMHMAAMACM